MLHAENVSAWYASHVRSSSELCSCLCDFAYPTDFGAMEGEKICIIILSLNVQLTNIYVTRHI